jgi:hypothetical protein
MSMNTIGNLLLVAGNVAGLGLIARRREWRRFWPLGLIFALQASEYGTWQLLSQLRAHHSAAIIYPIYFWTYWGLFALRGVLIAIQIYKLIGDSAGPYNGIRRAAYGVFFLAMTLAVEWAVVPQTRGIMVVLMPVSNVNTSVAILALLLLAVLAFTVQPLGMTHRSRAFGIALCLAVPSVCSLLERTTVKTNRQDALHLINFSASLLGCALCIAWLLMREPARQPILPGSRIWRVNQRLETLLRCSSA